MSSGIRATVAVTTPEGCPLAEFSRAVETSITQVSTSSARADDVGNTTEFLAPTARATDAQPDSVRGPIFSYGDTAIYRFEHDTDTTCPCTCLGSYGCPIHRYDVEDGTLTVVFHAETFDQLQSIMADFRDQFDAVDVQQLLRPPLKGTPKERVFVNRGKLTDRQEEVLETAFDMGYFERPKGANATEIAATLDIAPSTVTEHLVAAQRKLLGDVLGRDS
ncbi:helix-turn-helix domain-containing protein [Halobacteria archaeon AArc-curdl1]|uniref:Helix-turn-helix domain-containing protein n=1 Tax=Natronosalvus hydrolyticus TaxID=2979988 RepID=A0AAP2Z5X5_9EURY|nr:helix-turn-helix domain-containing protein [Halobacteria archaeon AArc-curdl1]